MVTRLSMAELIFNLKRSLVNEYWKQKDISIFHALKKLEEAEYWVADDDKDVEQALQEFITLFEKRDREFIKTKVPEILDVMAYLSISKVLRWLNHIDEKFDDTFSLHFIEVAVQEVRKNKEDYRKKIMLDRLRIIRTLDRLNKIYNPDRLNRINQMLQDLK